ncbi:hypothetical protein [Variovorax sp. OK605]|uniref:hypothetical protein n=1 Tax=Variovorax sp. OK605 TaxID=1855317 RepID=UPI0011609E75|nr:hypothetical protein [Variovorax sp. OK605]
MNSNSTPSAPTPRWYGNATSPYTPQDTQRLPRLGRINDFYPISHGVIGVVLQDGSVVLVEERDYSLMQAAGWSGRWTQRKVTGNNCYPSINHGDKISPLARIILDAHKGETVRYRNGDRNDLTRENLILKAKGGKVMGFSGRTCPQAPILSRDERGRVIAAVATSVGSASIDDRVNVGEMAVRAAAPRVAAYRAALGGQA